MITKVVHRNLLQLQGFCMRQTERLIVYPYTVNGSVASCLHDRPDTQPALYWSTRKRIALGSARGLAFLHDHCDPKIIHRYVKASSILFDEEFVAVIGDFGLAKLMDYNDTHVTTHARGFIGHIALKQRAYDRARLDNHNEILLLDLVKRLLKDKNLKTLVDTELEGNYMEDEVEKLIQIAVLCTQVKPMERPKISKVVKMLEGDGLAERWKEWHKEEILQHKDIYTHNLNIDCVIVDSNYNLSNDQLSGAR
ncbi:unnamed protein product [Lactuca saligna]|uniref:non-specific serine/threonine protein kinase n=1 Tax=Lactuca saligna TaxID=75948 RepID=A0AA36A471_LACSI|nr:unnamed protein product [Lactuca saligna]